MKKENRFWAWIVMPCFLGLIGCSSYRYDYYAFAEKCDKDIATKYRYKIVGYKTKAFDEYRQYVSDKQVKEYEANMLKSYKSEFSKCFPNVFSEDGIPIVLKDISSTSDHEMPPTVVLSVLTLFAIPNWLQWNSETALAVCIANSSDAESNIKIGMSTKRVMSSIIPPSLLLDDMPTKWASNAGCFTSISGNTAAFLTDSAGEFNGAYKPWAYALAYRLKEMEDSGQIDYYHAVNELRRRTVAGRTSTIDVPDSPSKRLYKILSLDRESDSDFVYNFTLELSEDVSISAVFGVLDIFAYEVQAAYQREFPNVDASTLQVVVHQQYSGGNIVGRAEVLTITPAALNYDANTRLGKLSVKFNANQYEQAREWIRKNIETLVREKKIALVAREIPPEARFYSLNESLKDGNILEIEFKTE